MTAQLVWLAKSTIQAGSGNPIIEASSIALYASPFLQLLFATLCTLPALL